MSPITTHVLDTSRGRPAAGIAVVLEQSQGGVSWVERARGTTNADGRIPGLVPNGHTLTSGVWRLRFATGDYFAGLGVRSFYPEVEVSFQVDDPAAHYHVPLLLSPYGYSTYRGS
jgi:5-hydroxyisourate hydrolase